VLCGRDKANIATCFEIGLEWLEDAWMFDRGRDYRAGMASGMMNDQIVRLCCSRCKDHVVILTRTYQ
jgi:hypothetical protein